jgi:hypothetical protein
MKLMNMVWNIRYLESSRSLGFVTRTFGPPGSVINCTDPARIRDLQSVHKKLKKKLYFRNIVAGIYSNLLYLNTDVNAPKK